NSATTNALRGACITAPVQDADVENRNVDTLIGTVYNANAPVTDLLLQVCEKAISKAGAKYLTTRMKLARTCEVNRGKGKVAFCPDAKAATKLETARAKLDKSIRADCTEDQLENSTMAPPLGFGFPGEAYKIVSYVRDPMGGNANVLPVLDRAIRCLTDAHAHVADRMAQIGFPAPELNAFIQGVAAGDATDTTAIFWTRLPDSTSGAFLGLST